MQFVRSKHLLIFLCFFSTATQATQGHVYLSGEIGAGRATIDNSSPKIISNGGAVIDMYSLDGSHASAPLYGLNVGYELVETCLSPIMGFAFGLGLYDIGNFNFNGQVLETTGSGPADKLYNYKFHLSSLRLLAEAKMTWLLNHFVPFIDMGIGAAWNHMSGYHENPINHSVTLALPPFQSNTNTNLSYQIGLGMGYAFNFSCKRTDFQHERIVLGYHYVSLGNASFGTRGSIYPYHLDMSTVTTNEFYLGYTHLF